MKLSNIKFRCTGEEKTIIRKKAARAGTTLSDYCRRQALEGKILEVPKLSPAQTQYLQAITTCHNNFARISNYMKNKSPELTEEIRKFLTDFKRLFYIFFPQN